MKRLVALATVVALAMAGFVATTAVSESTPKSNAPHKQPTPTRCTVQSFRPFSKAVWRLRAWERGNPPAKVIRAVRRREACAPAPHRAAMVRTWERDRAAYFAHRKVERHRLAVTPYDCGGGIRSAVPCYIPYRESGYDIRARNPSSTAGGFYQILDSTWYLYGGSRYADSYPAAVAPKLEQDEVAARIWDGGAGCSAWVTC